MFLEPGEKAIKCEPIENGKFRVTVTMIDVMDAEMYLEQIKNIQDALDNQKKHQETLPLKHKTDMDTIQKNVQSQTKFLESFKANEELAKSLLPKAN